MIIWSPFILDELAGLRDSAPPTITDDPTSGNWHPKQALLQHLEDLQILSGAAWADIKVF